MSPSDVCATGTGIEAARALIPWTELATLGERCSRWPSWLWPLIIDGTIIPGHVGDCRVGALPRPAAESGFFSVVLGIAAPSVGGNVLHARLATAQLASWTRAAGETWRHGGVAPYFSCHIAAACSTRWNPRLG